MGSHSRQYLATGRVLLQAATYFFNNSASVHGALLYNDAGSISYSLPAPRGHWISATQCVRYYKACPENNAGPCVRSQQPLASFQPCDWESQPEFEGRYISTLPEGPTNHPEYPFPCGKVQTPPSPARALQPVHCSMCEPVLAFSVTSTLVATPHALYGSLCRFAPAIVQSRITLPPPAGSLWQFDRGE